jgi:hypothetical protein
VKLLPLICKEIYLCRSHTKTLGDSKAACLQQRLDPNCGLTLAPHLIHSANKAYLLEDLFMLTISSPTQHVPHTTSKPEQQDKNCLNKARWRTRRKVSFSQHHIQITASLSLLDAIPPGDINLATKEAKEASALAAINPLPKEVKETRRAEQVRSAHLSIVSFQLTADLSSSPVSRSSARHLSRNPSPSPPLRCSWSPPWMRILRLPSSASGARTRLFPCSRPVSAEPASRSSARTAST